MTRIRFISADGRQVREVDGAPGLRLLEVAQEANQPLEVTCVGQLACPPCHVLVAAEGVGNRPPASEVQDHLLDLDAHVTRYSRLACQIVLTEALDSLTVRMPAGANNMQGVR